MDDFISTFESPDDVEKPKIKRQQKPRKILHVWTEKQCFQLISSVESHRCLWDAGSAEYKNARKEDSWREVVDELGCDIQVDDAKSKWMNLRSTFKTNISKVRKTKSGQGANESVKVHWRFFDALMFLEVNDVAMSTESTSSMPSVILNFIKSFFFDFVIDLVFQQVGVTDRSLLPDLGVDDEPSPTTVGQRKKRSRYTPTPTPPKSPSSSSSVNYKNIAAHALTNLKELDKHAAFGEYIAAELRALTDADSDALRQKFSLTLFNFLENRRLKQNQYSQN